MNERERQLKEMMYVCSGLTDFTLEVVPRHSVRYWARYFPAKKLIRIYGKDASGKFYPMETLFREALHELAHHFQFHHVPFWAPGEDDHDAMFWILYQRLLDEAFGEDRVEARPYRDGEVASAKVLPFLLVGEAEELANAL